MWLQGTGGLAIQVFVHTASWLLAKGTETEVVMQHEMRLCSWTQKLKLQHKPVA